jgi:hypothetical protein
MIKMPLHSLFQLGKEGARQRHEKDKGREERKWKLKI